MWVVFLIFGLALLLAIVLVIVFVQYTRDYWRFLEIPHETPKTILELLRTLCGQTPKTYTESHEHHTVLYKRFKGTGPFCGFYQCIQPRVLVLDRDLIKRILINDFSNFNGRGEYYNSKHDPLSGILYNLHGEAWKEMRLKLEPLYGEDQMSALFPSMYAECHKLLLSIEGALMESKGNSYVEVKSRLRRYVLDSIAGNVFGLAGHLQFKYPMEEFDLKAQMALHHKRHGDLMSRYLARHPKLGRRLRFANTPKEVCQYFMPLLEDVVQQRMSNRSDSQMDYLQLLINLMNRELSTHVTTTEKQAKGLKVHLMNELAAHAFSFLQSGLESTVNTIYFVLYELALNPDIQDQLRDEIKETLRSNDNEYTYECLRKLKLMDQVILETIRLHPIKPYLKRRVLHEYRVPNHPKYIMRKDMYVIIPTHAIHNDPAYYPEPERFKPERFSEEENNKRELCTWLGFGEGPRSCIGVHFAQLQMRLALVHLLNRYRFQLDSRRVSARYPRGVALSIQTIEGESSQWRESSIVI